MTTPPQPHTLRSLAAPYMDGSAGMDEEAVNEMLRTLLARVEGLVSELEASRHYDTPDEESAARVADYWCARLRALADAPLPPAPVAP